MAERSVGAAVVIDPEQPGPGIITERDILQSVGKGQDPDEERVADHLSPQLTFAAPDWSLERAAEAMVRGGFRHLVVVDGGRMTGMLSMRDIVRSGSRTAPPASCRRTSRRRSADSLDHQHRLAGTTHGGHALSLLFEVRARDPRELLDAQLELLALRLGPPEPGEPPVAQHHSGAGDRAEQPLAQARIGGQERPVGLL